MSRVLYHGGRVVRPDDRGPQPADVLVEDGVIRAVEAGLDGGEDTERVDCTGKILLPGLYDMLVHLREPGREDRETIASGSAAARNGGVTGILAMPNTHPPIDSGSMVQFVRTLARERACVPVDTAGCVTRGRAGEQIAEIGDMQAHGAVMITDDGSSVANPRVLLRAMEYARNFDMLIGSHCATPALDAHGVMNAGPMSYRLGLPGLLAASEEICIERDLRLAQQAGCRIHIQQVTTARGCEILRRYKDEGVPVTAEVSPHHLLFTDEDLADYDTSLKMYPPLRGAEDRTALLAALNDGTIDVIASDHAPHTTFDKQKDFNQAPFGILGLETALLSLHDRLIRAGQLDWRTLVRAYSRRPREILGKPPVEIAPDRPAEFVVFDPAAETLVDENFLRSRSHNTPFLGQRLAGRVDKVLVQHTTG